MKRIILSESQLRDNIIKEINSEEEYLRNLVKECISSHKERGLLFEDRESKNMKRARNVVRQYNPSYDAMEVITAIRNDIPNSRINQCEYLPGVTRLVLSGELDDRRKVSEVNSLLKVLGNAHANEYNNDLNGLSADELINKFSTEVDLEYETDVEAHRNTEFVVNNDYRIIRIESTQDAWPYSKYTDWCITSSEPGDNYDEDEWTDEYGDNNFDPSESPEQTSGYDMYKNYTHGSGVFYFILKDGFENIKRVATEGCPLDEYGLSMIATSVDDKGRCNTITCRWNHDKGGNDEVMTPMELSKLIGRNYYEVFKPYSEEERKERGIVTFDEINAMIQKGENIDNIVKIVNKIKSSNGDNCCIVEFQDLYNIIDFTKNCLMLPRWYERIRLTRDNICIIEDNGLVNFINTDCNFLFNEWFEGRCHEFNNGLGIITDYKNGMSFNTIISSKGEILTKKPLKGRIEKIMGKFVISYLQGKYCLYNFNKGFICHLTDYSEYESYESIMEIGDGYVMVSPNKRGVICLRDNGTEFGTRIQASKFRKSNNCIIAIDPYHHIEIYNLSGEMILSNISIMENSGHLDIYETAAIIKNNHGKVNIFNTISLRLLLDEWVDNCIVYKNFTKNFYGICKDSQWWILDDDGSLLINESFDELRTYDLPIIVKKGNKYNFLSQDGKLMDIWFDKIENFYDNYLGISNGKKYIINSHDLYIRLWSQEYVDYKRKEYDQLRWEKNRDF